MIKVRVLKDNYVTLQWNQDTYNMFYIRPEEDLDQLIADLQEAAVRLKANQLTEAYATPKSPIDKLSDEIEQLKERVNMLEHNNLRKL